MLRTKLALPLYRSLSLAHLEVIRDILVVAQWPYYCVWQVWVGKAYFLTLFSGKYDRHTCSPSNIHPIYRFRIQLKVII